MVANRTMPRMLRRAEIEAMMGFSSRTLYRRIEKGEFPAPVDIGGGRVRWREDKLIEWLESRPNGA